MPDFFETELRSGTAQAVDFLAPPSAEAVRGHAERRTRQRRAGAGAVALVLMVGGTALGLARAGSAHSGVADGPALVTTTSPDTSPSPHGAVSPLPGAGTLGVQLTPPARYAAATSNKVLLTIDNPGPARQVVVEFDAPGSKAYYWVEPCDSGTGGGCSQQSYDDNPLKVSSHSPGSPALVDFDLALPTGTSSYSAWVDPPAGPTSYTVRVLDGKTVLGRTGSETINLGYVFPRLSKASQNATTLVRGGSAVEFTTEIDNETSASYVELASFSTLACKAGSTTVTVPQGAYTLDWYTGMKWANVGAPRAPGQFGYDLSAGRSTSTRFRLAVSKTMPADVTSCQVTQLVSASITWTPPYYDQNAPSTQTTVDFTVG